MKLHLPVSLFKAVLSLLTVAAVVTSVPVSASVQHQDASVVTYTDFGQNAGRYSVGVTNALLQYVNRNGVVLTYTGGQADYVLPHGMIDFSAGYYRSTAAAISANCVATVKHNGAISADFTQQYYGIGTENAIRYQAIEYKGDATFSQVVDPSHPSAAASYQTDHKVTRLSKIITDVDPAEIYDNSKTTGGMLGYHAGSGRFTLSDYGGNLNQLAGSYSYVTGGIMQLNGYSGTLGDSYAIYHRLDYGQGGISTSNPLPWISLNGDSGSPLYVWNNETQSYQYFGGTYGGDAGNRYTIVASNTTFDKATVESYHEYVQMQGLGTVCLNAVTGVGETVTSGEHSTTKRYGNVTDASGNVLTNTAGHAVEYNGLASGLNTWGDLSALKDTQNWYSYNQSYLLPSIEDLFFTEDLVFESAGSENNIVLNATVDLGVGYAQFSKANGAEGVVRYDISSGGNGSYQFNHAGYVVDSGVEVHSTLTGNSNHMYEWRKIGGGDFYIEGSGNNHILLNVGGEGSTYLNRTNGYAAYNVLVNNGSTVVISDVNQIKRDLTFGNRGGTLDLNNQNLDWYLTAESPESNRAGFSINALTEAALIANYTGSSTLTYKEGGNTRYLGSFADSATGSLKVVYDGNGRWELNSIRTNLQHADSGLLVNNGTVALSGTNTVHAYGSDLSTENDRYFNEDDWHYADATMNVTVRDSGTFELGSHARLTGDVMVEQGGTYVMREAVRHRLEYVEGGQRLEDTAQYSAYFGHKGNVQLNGGTFAVQFNDGVDANTSYAYNVTGTGTMTVDTGVLGASFTFSGAVDSGISKILNRGQLILEGAAAADTGNKWLVNAGGAMVQLENAQDTLLVIDSASKGTLALTQDCNRQLDMSLHAGLAVGAMSGRIVQYGAAGTSEALDTSARLGGGGKLVVNYVLSGADTLNVDAGGIAGGEVVLQQVATGYSGTVNVQSSGGRMTLSTAQNGAFDAATVNLNEGGVWKLTEGQSVGGVVNINSGGILRANGGSLSGSAGVVELYGAMEYDSFTVSNGATLNLREGGRLDSTNAVTIAEGGIMRLNTHTLQDKVELKNGGIMYGNGGTIGATAEVQATEGTGKLSAGGGTFTVNGQIGAAVGSTLRLENGTFSIYTSEINSAGGVLELSSNTYLGHRTAYATQNIGGTLSVVENSTLHTEQGDPSRYQTITHNINHLHISNGKKLVITDSSSDWNHIYNISLLTGAGEIEWKGVNRWFDNTPAGPSRLVLNGDNSFEGTLLVNQQDNHGSTQHVALAHDNAAKNMVINLWGDSNSRPGLAISTANANVAGIGGTTNTFVYAGAVKTSGNGNNPTSTALNTLTINTKGVDHTYNGTILGDATNGLNIVKTGEGSQTFTSSANVVHDVTALQGHLNFSVAPTIHGDISIAQGAQMTIGSDALSLNEGHTLHVLAGTPGEQAVLNNALVLNGCSLHFEAYSASAGNAPLSTAGVSGTGVTTVGFGNAGAIQLNTTQWLATGDWSGIGTQPRISTPEYLNATLNAGTQGLSAVFSMADGYCRWEDVDSNLSANDKVVFVFGGGAEIAESFVCGTGLFDSATTYTVNGESLTFDSMVKSNRGELVLNAAVSAGTLRVADDSTISGNGSLSATTLTAEANITTGLSVDAANIQGNGHMWTLDGSEKQFTQTATVTQVNTFSQLNVKGQAELELSTDGDSSLNVAINGDGSVSKGGEGKLTSTNHVQIGTLNVNSGTYEAQDAVDIDLLKVANGSEVTMYNSTAAAAGDKNLGTVELGTGAIFQTNDREIVTTATTIGCVQMNGTSATLQDVHHSGYMVIESLRLADNVNSAELVLTKNAASTYSTVFEFGAAGEEAGNFAGTITLNELNNGSSRSAFVVISNEEIAQNAVISIADAQSSNATVGLGVNAAQVTIAGLKSVSGDTAKLFSGTVGFGQAWNASLATVGKEVRTLTIDTAANGNYTFYGEVMGNLNLVKEGAGTQQLAGSSANFNGSIRVENGTLVLGGSAHGMLGTASSVVVNGGKLELLTTGNAVNLSNATVELGANAIFQTNDREKVTASTTIGCVQMNGTFATLQDVHHSGYMVIESLRLADNVNSAELVLTKNASSSYSTVFEFGSADAEAGNFAGTITLNELNNGNKRSAFVVISNELVAQNAVISIADAQSSNATVGLGVNAAQVTIAGLKSVSGDPAKLFSGTVGFGQEWSASLATVGKVARTLTIDTAANCNYTFYGEVMGNLNLVKEGAGTQQLAGSSANFNGSIRVENGTLVLGSNALGMLETASSVVVNGGRLDLSAAGSSANLTYISGEGAVVLQYNMVGNGTAFDFSTFSGVVELAGGRILLNESTFGEECPDFLLTSSNSQLVFNGNGTVVNSNVHISANTTDFHVNSGKSGTIGGDITGNSLVKCGDGILTVGGNMKLNSMLSTRSGQVILTGTQNTVANVDCSMGSTAEGTLRLAQDSRLEVTGNIWSRNNTGILLDSGAELNISDKELTITNRAEEGTASLAATTSTDPGEYTISRTGYQISNAHVTYTGGDATINNKLTNSSIENAGSGTLKVNNAENTLSAVYATGGSVKLFSAEELDLKALEVAASLSVSAYCDVREKVEEEARISVSEIATFGTGVTLNADLVMKSGATLNIAGTVQMGSDVRLETGLSLAGSQYDTLSSLKVGEKVTLFSGVDSLFLGDSSVASTAFTLDDHVLANEYFTNLSDLYFLVYDTTAGAGLGELSIAVVPEPTTATLSLLALAGLAARRRRK